MYDMPDYRSQLPSHDGFRSFHLKILLIYPTCKYCTLGVIHDTDESCTIIMYQARLDSKGKSRMPRCTTPHLYGIFEFYSTFAVCTGIRDR